MHSIFWFQLLISLVLLAGGLLALVRPGARMFTSSHLASPAAPGLVRTIGCLLIIGSIGIFITNLKQN